MMRRGTGTGQLEIREGMTVTPAQDALEVGTAMKVVEGMKTVRGIDDADATKTKLLNIITNK